VIESPVVKTLSWLTPHQLDVLRTELTTMARPDGPFVKGSKTILRDKQLEKIAALLEHSRVWYYFLDFAGVIREVGNLSSLWFREVYLDMDKVTQFPVGSSLPFRLIEHLLNSTHPDIQDMIMFPFEIYNDCASSALGTYKSRYLYREIEAEVQLATDMIAVQVSEALYRSFMNWAAAVECGRSEVIPNGQRFDIAVRQNKTLLLGAPIDFNSVACDKLNDKFQKELEKVLETADDFRTVGRLSRMLRVLRTAHMLLMGSNLKLVPFESILAKAKGIANPLSPESALMRRIVDGMDWAHWLLSVEGRKFATRAREDDKNTGGVFEPVFNGPEELAFIDEANFTGLLDVLSSDEQAFMYLELVRAVTEHVETKFVPAYAAALEAAHVAEHIYADDFGSFFMVSRDAHSDVTFPAMGALLNTLRVIGNLIAFARYLDESSGVGGPTLSAVVLGAVKASLTKFRGLLEDEGFDVRVRGGHRGFASVWTVFEVLFCIDDAKLGGAREQLLATFGDGPQLAALVFVSMLGQEAAYRFDSMLARLLELASVEQAKKLTEEQARFVQRAEGLAAVGVTARAWASGYTLDS
jgi:hypothetical protein